MSNIDEQIDQIASSGALGRSPVYERLLRYLGKRTAEGSLPKEIDIAADVFDRKAFDPANDSTVRVYLHNLRQKLDTHYRAMPSPAEIRIQIPKGEYRLELVAANETAESVASVQPGRRYAWAVAALLAFVAAFVTGRVTAPPASEIDDELAATEVWQTVLDDDLPVNVVVGDYYVFAEIGEDGISNRLIRDFGVNDSLALDRYLDMNPDLKDQYIDVQLSYLPLGVGSALEAVMRVLHRSGKTVRVIPQSQFRTQMLRGAHVVYLGYLSGMGRLARYPFAASRLAVGMSYDELIDMDSGESYVSRAGYITDDDAGYTDYGYFSTFPGPSGNQFLIVAGMRDEGMMRMASILADAGEVRDMTETLDLSALANANVAFEALYEVRSLDRTYVAAKRLFVASLDTRVIWEN